MEAAIEARVVSHTVGYRGGAVIEGRITPPPRAAFLLRIKSSARRRYACIAPR